MMPRGSSLLVEPDAVEQLERRRMVRARARHLFEEIVVAERLDQADRYALLAPAPATGKARPARRRRRSLGLILSRMLFSRVLALRAFSV